MHAENPELEFNEENVKVKGKNMIIIFLVDRVFEIKFENNKALYDLQNDIGYNIDLIDFIMMNQIKNESNFFGEYVRHVNAKYLSSQVNQTVYGKILS
jgi:hypothetical protein